MKITKLKIKHFKTYEDGTFNFDEHNTFYKLLQLIDNET
jgi:chromosome segregation ATPase